MMNSDDVIKRLTTDLENTEFGTMYKKIQVDMDLVTIAEHCEAYAKRAKALPAYNLTETDVRLLYNRIENLARDRLKNWLNQWECYFEFHPQPVPGKNIPTYVYHIGRHDSLVYQFMTYLNCCEPKILKFHSIHPSFNNLALYYCLLKNEPGTVRFFYPGDEEQNRRLMRVTL